VHDLRQRLEEDRSTRLSDRQGEVHVLVVGGEVVLVEPADFPEKVLGTMSAAPET
jgi:hypothetical protein